MINSFFYRIELILNTRARKSTTLLTLMYIVFLHKKCYRLFFISSLFLFSCQCLNLEIQNISAYQFENILKTLCKKWMKAVNWFVVYYRLTYDPCLVSQNCLASFTIGRIHCELHHFHSLRTFYKSSWSSTTRKVSWQNLTDNFSANVTIKKIHLSIQVIKY